MWKTVYIELKVVLVKVSLHTSPGREIGIQEFTCRNAFKGDGAGAGLGRGRS